MNTVRILICATFALLIAALVHTISTKNDPPKEKSLSDLKEEYEKLKLENKIKRERAAANPIAYREFGTGTPYTAPVNPAVPLATSPITPPPFVNPLANKDYTTAVAAPAIPVTPPATAPSAEALAKINALQAENAKLKEKRDQQELENNLLNQETDVIKNEIQAQNLEQRKPEGARAAEIAQALVMARVKIYDIDSGIIVLDLVRAQNLITGQILGIRRGEAGGIIGRVKLGNIDSAELGYADPIAESFFGGPVDVRVGDELIVIP